MQRISLSLFACVAFGALAISSASAAGRLASFAAAPVVATSATASSEKAPTSRPCSANRKQAHALTRAARKARKPSKAMAVVLAPTRVIIEKASNENFATAQKAAQAESNARTERLYRDSQVSAPIIIDAKACKRIGAHGESIYENCSTASASVQ
jgi:hypothetical protein